MARMLSQLPLPLLPAGAAEIAPGVGLVLARTAGWSRCTGWPPSRGMPGMRRAAGWRRCSWSGCGPPAQGQVAEAFGVDPVTIWRWDQALAAGGVAGLVPARRGPKGASKLTPQLVARIAGLDAAGATLRRDRRGDRGVDVQRPQRAGPGGAAGAGGRGAPEGTRRPATPGTVTRRRARRCRCCRTRCPGTGSGRWPGGGCWARAPSRCSRRAPAIRWPGCCWRCRRWRAPACWRPPGEVYGRLRDGFYGLDATLLTLVFLALAGEPRAEGATRVPPAALGRVLGLDRAPEVKTIRRKLAELAAAGKAAGPDHGAGPPPRRRPAGRARVPLRRRARPRLLRHPQGAEDPRGPAEVPRPGHRWRPGSPIRTATRCSWSSPSRRSRWPASCAGCSRSCGRSWARAAGDGVLRPGRLVPGAVRRHHRRRVRPAHLAQGPGPRPARRRVHHRHLHR